MRILALISSVLVIATQVPAQAQLVVPSKTVNSQNVIPPQSVLADSGQPLTPSRTVSTGSRFASFGSWKNRLKGKGTNAQLAQSTDPSRADPVLRPPASTASNATPARRGFPSPDAPLDPVFAMQEWIGSDGGAPMGIPDSGAIYPVEKFLWKNCPLIRKARIRLYGWANPGYGYSTSHHTNFPLSYFIVPRKPQLDQLIFRVERVPDTVQTEHIDWGFRYTGLYGIDYRFTTSQGWYPASKTLLEHNRLYGFDQGVECYGLLYIPKIAKGLMLKAGRYISPPDIEAQLAPDNFLWTHSQMFTVDAYTQTGILASVKLNNQWTVQAGIHAGSDMAAWDNCAIPTGQLLLKWISKNNNDSIYGGVNSINNGHYRLARQTTDVAIMTNLANTLGAPQPILNPETGELIGMTPQITVTPRKVQPHDNLQQFNLTWSHRFNKRGTVFTMTEGYILYQIDALQGGTVVNGPPRTYFALTGPGRLLPNVSLAWGIVNYTGIKVTNKDYITIRPIDFLGDCRGQRTGFPTTYSTWTIGWTHRFNDLVCIRPEIRYERALNYHNGTIVTPYDNGTRRSQLTFGLDVIQRF